MKATPGLILAIWTTTMVLYFAKKADSVPIQIVEMSKLPNVNSITLIVGLYYLVRHIDLYFLATEYYFTF